MIETIYLFIALSAFGALSIQSIQGRKRKKRYEEKLKRYTQQFDLDLADAKKERNHILDALGDAFLIVDSDSNVIFANTAASDLFRGRSLTGRPVAEAFFDPRLADALLRCLATGEPVSKRIILAQQTSPRGDLENRGHNAWVIDAAKLSGTPNTRVVIRDVTSEHQLDQIRKDFVANASHELRTPLAIINGYLENLLDDGMIDEPEMVRRFLSVMKKHTDRISRIVEDMLVISRLESGEASAIKIEPFQFKSCIKDILERLESLIHNQHAIVTVNQQSGEISLEGDRFYWTQVLFNLVENALKQNSTKELKVEIGSKEEGDQFLIWVKDNGIGIPSSDLPHIFRRFYRVEKHHSQLEVKGTGLGLSIVKRAIEAHHGTISVSSTPGVETKFLMTIPKKFVHSLNASLN